jgi:hypothetical protein
MNKEEKNSPEKTAAPLRGESVDGKVPYQQQLQWLSQELRRQSADALELRKELAALQAENGRLLEQLLHAQEENSISTKMLAAIAQLNLSSSRDQAIATIQEIVTNLVGSEQFALFELDTENSVLRLASSLGVVPPRVPALPLGSGIIGRSVAERAIYVSNAGQRHREAFNIEDVHVCIPLQSKGKVVGAIAIYGLLPQKNGLEAMDYELFDLLAKHAAAALAAHT